MSEWTNLFITRDESRTKHRERNVDYLDTDVQQYVGRYTTGARQPWAVYRLASGEYYASEGAGWDTGHHQLRGNPAELSAGIRQWLNTYGILAPGIRPGSNDPRVYINPYTGAVIGGETYEGWIQSDDPTQPRQPVITMPDEMGFGGTPAAGGIGAAALLGLAALWLLRK